MKNPVSIFILFSCTFLAACSQKNFSSRPAYQFSAADGTPDYSNISYWAAHPWKWDPSDSIPQPLRNDYRKDSLADVFFLYPTTYTSPDAQNTNAGIDDTELNVKTDYSPILYQASAFSEKNRVFAPRYRQAHIRNYYTHDTLAAAAAFDLAYQDVKAAFIYYMDHYNNGRPVIIASHSQGTTHAIRLLKEFFDDKPLQNQLVCAYILGMPVAENYFTTIPVCTDSLSTGCYVTWRTYHTGYEGTAYVQAEKFNVKVTNPLTWTTGNGYASDKLNTGGILKNFNKLVPAVVDAQVHQNILWSSKPKFFGNILLRSQNYHIGDINLFYNNIRENVSARIRAFNQRK